MGQGKRALRVRDKLLEVVDASFDVGASTQFFHDDVDAVIVTERILPAP